jgi:hypothetical protein
MPAAEQAASPASAPSKSPASAAPLVDCRLCKYTNEHKNWKIGDPGRPQACSMCMGGSLFVHVDFRPLWLQDNRPQNFGFNPVTKL